MSEPKYKAIRSFLADGNYWCQGQTVPAEVAEMYPDKVELVK